MDDIAIKVENLNKIYKLYDKPIDRLKESLNPIRKKYYTEFYALRDISFEIKKGETVGIIGKNGSGKSTLLKIITGVLTQTTGNVLVNGKVSALLELGAGFNPELTGIENVYLNGMIMGYSKIEMDERLSEILSFADIGEFVHQPVKTYSSGMFVRLAFAVAISIEPEILIVDEALSVGDIAFQAKCYRKFMEFKKKGKTIIFVTHSLDSVLRFCTKTIVLDNGIKINEGSSREMVDIYKKLLANCYKADIELKPDGLNNSFEEHKVWKDNFIRNTGTLEYGNKLIEIIDYGIFNEHGDPVSSFMSDDLVVIKLKIRMHKTIENPIFAFSIKDVKGNELIGTNTLFEGIDTGICKENEEFEVTFTQRLMLTSSTYFLSLGCTGYNNDELIIYHRLYDLLMLTITSSKRIAGVFDSDTVIDIKKI